MKRNNRGFTLIEVMVAIAIFAMAALAAVSAASGHLNSLSTIQQRTFAQYVAANRLTDLNLANTWPIKDNQRGSERQGGVEWQWRQQVVETVTPNVVAVTVLMILRDGLVPPPRSTSSRDERAFQARRGPVLRPGAHLIRLQ